MAPPIGLVIFQLKAKIARKTTSNMRNNIPIEHPMPTDETTMAFPLAIVHKSQGSGKLERNKSFNGMGGSLIVPLP